MTTTLDDIWHAIDAGHVRIERERSILGDETSLAVYALNGYQVSPDFLSAVKEHSLAIFARLIARDIARKPYI